MGEVIPIDRCGMCRGQGTVSDGTDERGRPREKTCPQCGGTG